MLLVRRTTKSYAKGQGTVRGYTRANHSFFHIVKCQGKHTSQSIAIIQVINGGSSKRYNSVSEEEGHATSFT